MVFVCTGSPPAPPSHFLSLNWTCVCPGAAAVYHNLLTPSTKQNCKAVVAIKLPSAFNGHAQRNRLLEGVKMPVGAERACRGLAR